MPRTRMKKNNLPYISIIYWKIHMSCLKFFSYIRQVFVWNVWCCTVSNFYHARDIAIIYYSGDGFLFVFLSELLSATYEYNWINIYRGWRNNGNTRQYWNKNCLCWLHWNNISCSFRYSFVCLCYVVPVSLRYRLCLGKICMKVLQNGRITQIFKEDSLLVRI